MTMPELEDDCCHILAMLQEALGPDAGLEQPEPAFPVLASPGWHGVDGAHWRVRSRHGPLHVKLLHEDARLYVDAAASCEAAVAAAERQVGPPVVHADPARGLLVMPDMSAWRVGTLERLYEPDLQTRVIELRRRFQAGPALSREVDLFALVRDLAVACRESGASLPPDFDGLAHAIARAGQAIRASGIDLAPCHGDGTASNLLLGPDGAIWLVDYDCAGMMDPFLDLGSLTVEVCAQEPEARSLFEQWHGRMDEALFARTMLYGAADDLRWGLIGALLAARSRRRSLEFIKYANWRFLRCRMAVQDPRFAERCRKV